MKSINERCPMSGECGKKKCEYERHELDCGYYNANARPDFEIADQEALRWKGSDNAASVLGEPEDGRSIYLPVSEIHPHPNNPRKDLGDLTELADSIKVNGVLQNLTVVKGHTVSLKEHIAMCKREGVSKAAAEGCYEPDVHDPEGYTVIIGHRRLAAAKLAGLESVPCVVTSLTPEEQVKTMLMENIQRSDLTVYEQAQGFQMMLDMGETVKSIADDTGFSQTTVRNRLEIAKLDKETLQKVQRRQASLQDYIDLSKIKDMEVRNKVLADIGTANFKLRLSQALDAQKNAKQCAEWEKVISTFAQKVSSIDYPRGACGCFADGNIRVKYVRNFSRWNMKKDSKIEIPEDAGIVKYYYKVSSEQIDLYQEDNEGAAKTEEQLRAEALKDDSERCRQKLKAMRDRHFKLRTDFIKHFGAVKTHMDVIVPMAADMLAGNGGQTINVDIDFAASLLGLTMPKKFESGNRYTWFKEELKACLRERPEQSLFLMAYSHLDSPNLSFYKAKWMSTVYRYYYKPSVKLNRVYDFLTALGYEMSDEEKDMRDGDSELFEKPEDFTESEADNG